MLGKKLADTVRWCLLTGGIFLLGSGGFRSSGFTGTEFECEQAVAHLKSCCPDFPVRSIRCNYSAGCGEVHPLLRTDEAKCVQNTSCDVIIADGVCQEVIDLAAQDAAFEPDGSGEEEFTHAPVCP